MNTPPTALLLIHKPEEVTVFISRMDELIGRNSNIQLEFNYCFAQFLLKYYSK